MQNLVNQINLLKKTSVGKTVRERIKEFKNLNEKEWFSELCFCLLTANTSARIGLKVQQTLGFRGFSRLNREELAKQLQKTGYRFYNIRAEFIANARNHIKIKNKITSFGNETTAREWLVQNIKGLGMKEASHFLRNVGYDNVSILDKHVLNLLQEHKIIQKPKNLNKNTYLDIEKKLERLSKKTKLSLGELDLYLWFLKTGQVLK